jgi:hypothetical protein
MRQNAAAGRLASGASLKIFNDETVGAFKAAYLEAQQFTFTSPVRVKKLSGSESSLPKRWVSRWLKSQNARTDWAFMGLWCQISLPPSNTRSKISGAVSQMILTKGYVSSRVVNFAFL